MAVNCARRRLAISGNCSEETSVVRANRRFFCASADSTRWLKPICDHSCAPCAANVSRSLNVSEQRISTVWAAGWTDSTFASMPGMEL